MELGTLEGTRHKLEESVVLALIPLLNDSDEVRANAAHTLSIVVSQSTIPYLAPLLKDPNASVRATTVEILGRIEPSKKSVIPLLIPLLKDSDVLVRLNTATILGEIGKAATSAIPSLISLLKDESQWVRSQAATSLGNMGKSAKVAIPDLIPLLKDPSSGVSGAAAKSLSKLGYTSVKTPDSGKTTVSTVGASGTSGKAIAVDQSSQAGEVQRFLEENWKSSEKLKSVLAYRVEIAPNGTRQALTPLTKESIVFIDHVPFPLEGEPFVSPNLKGFSTVVRIIIGPNNSIQVFLEE
jgi:HEAT repeats/HEAT repeat